MTKGQNLAEGAAGIALLHLETGNWEAAYAALEQAVTDGVSIGDGASLYYGAPALAFVLATSDQPDLTRAKAAAAAGTATVTRHRLEAAHRRIDQHQRPTYAEFDLIRGLTGLGVTLRRIGDLDLLREVLSYLVRLTEPIDRLPGWWCPTGPSRNQPGPAGGHSNHGMAHGVTGPLALLALAVSDGVEVDGQRAAITRSCQWLDHWERQSDGGAWWPEIITLDELRRGETSQSGPRRPSWCYGTPGIARAQQLAARALGDTARQRRAETAFAACVSGPEQLARLVDRGLCHGTGGLVATGRRIAADALTPIPVTPLLNLHQHATAAPDEPPGFLIHRRRPATPPRHGPSERNRQRLAHRVRGGGQTAESPAGERPAHTRDPRRDRPPRDLPLEPDRNHQRHTGRTRAGSEGSNLQRSLLNQAVQVDNVLIELAPLLHAIGQTGLGCWWIRKDDTVRRLLTVDTGPLRTDGSLEFAADWFTAFEQAGAALAALNRDGLLTRGLRAVIAHHTIFAWNRLGFPTQAQAAIAHTSKEVILGEPTQNP